MKKLFFYILLAGILSASCKSNKTKTPPDNKKVTESKIESKEDDKKEVSVKKKKFNDLPPMSEEDSLDFKIGQMIMVGINERTSITPDDPIAKEIKANKAGNIILFEKNITKTNSYESLKKLITDLQSLARIPMIMSIDEEGGKVHRLKEKYGFVKMPSAAYLGSLPGTDSTFFYAEQLAAELKDLGFNINFAPVVDVAYNPENPIIAKVNRSYSNDPEIVTQHAAAFIEAHHKHNVKITLKHFPGHGSSATDSHKGIADVTKQWRFTELLPYKKLIDAELCDAIVSCHIINCHLDTNCIPSTLSPITNTEILRELLGFKGVVFSDDMQMAAIAKNYGMDKAIEMAINSGVDVLVYGNNVNASDRLTPSELHAKIKKLVTDGKISKSRIDEAYKRIIELKLSML